MKRFLILISLALLVGCETAPKTIQFDSSLLSVPNSKVAVAVAKLPKPNYYLFGSQ